ncbi:MAG TPA: hypothetical protein DCS97_03620 [Planctomycetes bacterium]|nr:hypothetical protein [Planctomycetota bacterium]
MAVTRCVCFRRSFAELVPQARSAGWTTLPQLAAGTGCGTGCGACRPYLERMLATGATSFAVARPGQEPQPARAEAWDMA